MSKPAGERWTFTMQMPEDAGDGGRYVARVLKWLWRCWRVRCVAVLDAPPEKPTAAEPNNDGRPR